jgi:aldose 1-epimerase
MHVAMELERENYQREIDGGKVDLYTLRNRNGMVVKATNWGAKVQQILVPDRAGQLGDVALGYDTISQLRAGQASMGAFIGRYAGRIAQARFTLNGRRYLLAANSGPNSLHGGDLGSRFRTFEATQIDAASVVMGYTFEDGEEGFPGTLALRVTYTVTDANELAIEYEAVASDKPTVANFTTHIFFNLAGHDRGDVLGHLLEVNADRFLPVNDALIPTGELRAVRSTPMDFTRPVKIGERIGLRDEQLRIGNGYDHHYVLNKEGAELGFAARVHDSASGRVMEVWTTEPGMQLYSGNYLEGKRPRDVGKGGAVYAIRAGLCLEPSHFPDSPNQPSFPTTVLNPGERRAGRTIYRFSVRQ